MCFVIIKISSLKFYFDLTQVKCGHYQQLLFLICPFDHSNVFEIVVFASIPLVFPVCVYTDYNKVLLVVVLQGSIFFPSKSSSMSSVLQLFLSNGIDFLKL